MDNSLEIVGKLILFYLSYKLITMSIKDINELPLPVKAIIISMGMFMPFWFLILYYFFPDIIQMDWYKIAAFVFVPTLIWYVLELGTSHLYVDALNITFKQNLLDGSDFWIAVFFDGLLYFGIITLVAYYVNYSFEKYAWIIFSFRAITFIWALIFNVYTHYKIQKSS